MKHLLRILVVDDDPLVKETLAAAIEDVGGAKVWAAGSGEEGLSLAELHRPDLILLDVDMPGLDGIGVCASLRAKPEMAQTVVWLFTGMTLDSETLQELSRHADRVLPKPLSLMQLSQEIQAQVHAKGPPLRLLS